MVLVLLSSSAATLQLEDVASLGQFKVQGLEFLGRYKVQGKTMMMMMMVMMLIIKIMKIFLFVFFFNGRNLGKGITVWCAWDDLNYKKGKGSMFEGRRKRKPKRSSQQYLRPKST